MLFTCHFSLTDGKHQSLQQARGNCRGQPEHCPACTATHSPVDRRTDRWTQAPLQMWLITNQPGVTYHPQQKDRDHLPPLCSSLSRGISISDLVQEPLVIYHGGPRDPVTRGGSCTPRSPPRWREHPFILPCQPGSLGRAPAGCFLPDENIQVLWRRRRGTGPKAAQAAQGGGESKTVQG